MWHILNFIPPPGVRRSSLSATIEAFNSAGNGEPIEAFAPTFIQIASEDGHVHKSEKPLLYHYIFVKGREADIKRLCHDCSGFSFVMDHSSTGSRHLLVSDEAVEQFRIIAKFYAGQLPCFPLDGINLEEGDRVQIVSGPCTGLTGTYISRKGGKKGNILVAIDGNMAAIVYDVQADFVRVLEFARDSKRVYDQLDSFAQKIPLQKISQPDLKLTAAAGVFSRRLGSLKLPNPKTDARLQILLYAAYCILADHENARKSLDRYKELERHVTNPKTQEFYNKILTTSQLT